MTETETVLWLFDEMSCGAVLLDRHDSILALNACAERIIAKHTLSAGRPKPNSRDKTACALRRLFGRAYSSSAAVIAASNSARAADARPLIARKIALGGSGEPTAVLVLVDLDERPRPSTNTLRETFGLTRAEAKLATHLAWGESLHRIAADQKISIDTTRAQLKSVLAKTRTHRQAELVALVNRLAPLP